MENAIRGIAVPGQDARVHSSAPRLKVLCPPDKRGGTALRFKRLKFAVERE